jgi:hypothetical protein
MELFDHFEMSFDPAAIVAQGGPKIARLVKRPRIAQVFEEILQIIPELVSPRFGVGRFTVVEARGDALILADGTELGTGPVFRKTMKGSTEVVVGVGTLGPKIDAKIAEFGRDNQMGAVVLDAIGSWLIGHFGNQVIAEMLARIRNEGLFHSIVMAPGDTEWDLRDQRQLFKLLEPEKIGVTLKESFLMVPTKSMSFAIGIAPQQYDIHDVARCLYCARKNTCDGSPYASKA